MVGVGGSVVEVVVVVVLVGVTGLPVVGVGDSNTVVGVLPPPADWVGGVVVAVPPAPPIEGLADVGPELF